MSGGLGKTKMKASDFKFTRVKTWLGGDQTERIEGWKTYVYEAAGKMKAVNITKVERQHHACHWRCPSFMPGPYICLSVCRFTVLWRCAALNHAA